MDLSDFALSQSSICDGHGFKAQLVKEEIWTARVESEGFKWWHLLLKKPSLGPSDFALSQSSKLSTNSVGKS